MWMLFAIWLGVAQHAPTACDVLSARDVAAVQGAKFKSKKLKETASSGMQISHCVYAMPHLSESVSVDVIRGDARAFFRKHFANVQPASLHQRPASRAARSVRVDGVGDEAVWSGNAVAGALYVLRGDQVVRVSVGGGLSQDEKIERAKQLALRALRRL
jgi:hypothetical protein